MISTWQRSNPLKTLLSHAKSRARKLSREFNLTLEDLAEHSHGPCPCCGQEFLKPQTNKRCAASPSLDRIDNAKGYTKDNFAIICWRCNRLKNDGSLKEFMNIVAYIRKYTQ